MFKSARSRLRAAVFACAAALGLGAYAASTYSTYKDDAETPTSGAFGNTMGQTFKLNATWMFNVAGDDIAASEAAVSLDSIKVYWHTAGHSSADIGKASGTQPDAYLVLTTPQNVVVGVSAVNDTAWSAGGSSTFAFSDTLISPNAQYYFYFATDVSAVQVGGSFSAGAQARFAGAWHGSSKTSDSDVHVGIGGSNTYSIRCDFAVSQTNAYASLETMSEGVNLSTGTDPVFVTGAVANGIVTVASGASVPSLTIVGEATTLALADTLSVGYLYLPAATTIDATGVTLAMPGDDETTATTTIVNGTISAASTPVVNLPTLPAGYDYGSTAIGDGITVTVTKSAGATLELTDGSVNWSDVKPADWVNGVASTITINYTGACTLVFDESVQAASITPVGTGSLVLERGTGATVDIAAVAIDQNAPAMDITFKNFTSIPPYSQYYTAATDVIRADGTETLVSHPLISTDGAHGSFYFTQPVTMDSFTLSGNKTAYFNTGATGTFGRFVLGNNGNRTQTVTQNDGTITVSGNAAPTSNQASILLGHWNGTVTLNTLGGTFNALNASTRLGWDGTATWAIGGGTDDAVANVLGIVNGENGHTGAGTLNIFANGTLNVGSGGIAFSNSGNGGVINLAGGTIKATADMTIANAKASGTILNQNKTTKLDTDEYTVTLSAPLSGSGVLNKQGSGTLKVTGAGTSTSRHEINGGTLLLSGNGATLGTGGFNMKGSGAHLDIEPGEGNTITLAADYLINSTSGNSSPVININAGTVENNCTGVSQYGQFGQSTVNVNDGAELKLNNARQLGWNMFTTLNVNNGGTLTIAAQQQLTRQLKLNGGTVKLTGVDVPLEVCGNRTITATADSSIVAEATETAASPAMVVSNGTLTVSVDAAKTLTLAAPVVDGAGATAIAQPVSKAGEGTLKLTKANTATGTLTVSAGTLALDGGSWAGTVAVGAAGTLDVITSETVADGALLAAGTFTLAEGATVKENGTAVDVAVEADGIHKVAKVAVTVPVVANTVVTVTVGGETVSPATEGGNIYKVAPGSVVTVTYAAADGYEISGTTEYTVNTASATTFEVAADMVTAQYVAQIRTGATTYEKYTTLTAALGSASAATAPITLLADVTENDITFAASASISGNNHTINANITIANGGRLQLMYAPLNGTLTIQSGGTYVTIGGTMGNVVVEDGGIINLTSLSEDTAPLAVSALTVNGALTIVSTYGLAERGKTYKAISYVTGNATIAEGASFNGSDQWSASTTVDGDNTVVCLAITKVAVVDGVYYDTAQEAVEAAVASGKQVQFLVQPGTVTLGAGETLVVKGGYQPTVELDAGLSTPPYEVESGYDITTGIYTYAVKSYVAQIGDDKYESIAAAVDAATSGQTVKLLADVTLTAPVTIPAGMTLTLDLGGNTINSQTLVINNRGNLTLANGTISAMSIARNAANGATVVVQSGTYTASYAAFLNADNVSGCAVTINGGTFTAQEAVVMTGKSSNSAITVNGGTLTALDNAVLMDNGTQGYAGNTITVTGGTLNGGITTAGYVACGIYCANDTTVTVTGGTFNITGGCGILARAGKVNVSGTAVINTTGTAIGKVGDSRVVVPCAPIVYDSAANYPGYDETTTTFAVSGGTFTANGEDVDCIVQVADEGDATPIAVSGGTFNTAVAETYCAEGFEPTDNKNGTYGVRVDKGWIYEDADFPGYTGSWNKEISYDETTHKAAIEDGATYTAAKASDGQFVTVAMTLSFDDVNDDEDGYEGAKAAIRLGAGEAEGAYVFQLYTYEGSAATWKNATGFTPTVETDYNVLFVLDLTNKTYTASIVSGATTNVLSIGESITAIPFAYQGEVTPVQTIDFVGSGTVSSIEGSYEDAPAPEGFVEDEVVTLAGDDTATLTAAQATWLNACGAKAAVAAKIATMDSTAFNNAYLLNLDITGEFSYEFKVTNINVGDTTVTMTVSLTRTGALDEATKINGTVALTGTDELGKKFETISEATVADDDFSESNTTTITLDKGDAKFFQPVIK